MGDSKGQVRRIHKTLHLFPMQHGYKVNIHIISDIKPIVISVAK